MVAGGTGTNIKSLNQTILSSINVPLPDSLKDQERIADRIEKVAIETRSLESIYRRKLAALAELKQSLLHQAFAGQL